jgi:hypothetical protein
MRMSCRCVEPTPKRWYKLCARVREERESEGREAAADVCFRLHTKTLLSLSLSRLSTDKRP